MTSPLLRVDDHGGIVVLTIDRPPANALAPDLLSASVEVLEGMMVDPPDAIVITGAGKFFCGGADLNVMPALSHDGQDTRPS